NVTATGSTVAVTGGSTFDLSGVGGVGNYTNNSAADLGSLTISGSSTVTTNTFLNNGNVSGVNGSELTTHAVTNNVKLKNVANSTFSTDVSGGFAAFTSTLGAVEVGGNSLFDVGSVTQTGGTVHIGGGAAGDTADYTLTGGSLSLINPSANAGTTAGFVDTL